MKKLTFLILLVSCTLLSNNPRGEYFTINKGVYYSLNFIDNTNVIVIDLLGITHTCTYLLNSNKIYIHSEQGDLVYIQKGDSLLPDTTSIFNSFQGIMVKGAKPIIKPSASNKTAAPQEQSPKPAPELIHQLRITPPVVHQKDSIVPDSIGE